ncbi:Aerotolerance protein BatB / Aerotolerance protein BatC [hydrothermal vent metagenome]|uniref:Aerotolerance protein BatB / Aerotolerance protein BatC n=1 Tax=hydrothermal vent metagenome TaxID=652676 RepID=A0A3B1AMB8_9ZZZZ
MDLTLFHFLRPLWLLAFLPLLVLAFSLWRRRSNGGIWKKIIDPRLLPYVLTEASSSKRHPLAFWLVTLSTALLIIAQAGPVWEKRPQPLFKQQSALVVALDLSRSMDATDLRPSRLARARFKLNDILDQRQEGQTALLVWAATAFTVTPLTDDVKTIRALLPSLSTEMMPEQGSRADRAIEKAISLLKNANQLRGDILLITDGADSHAANAARKAHEQGYRISVLAVGTAEGAPIPLPAGDFLKDRNGAIVIPKLNRPHLQQLAQQGGGRFSSFTTDDRDTSYLLAPINEVQFDQAGKESQLKTDTWYEQGPWLVLLVLPLAALLFRRGEIFLLLLFLLPAIPQPAQAFEWPALWLNQDQQAEKLLQNNQPEAAAKKFNDLQWKAAAEYRAGRYQQTIENLQDIDTADSWYNRGNALAKSGRLQEAQQAYAQALKKDPQHEDAKYNKKLIEDAQKQQQQQDQKSDSKSDQQKKKKQNSQSDSDDSQQSEQQQDSTDSQQNKNAEQTSEKNKDMKEQDNTQQAKQAEEEQSSDKENKAEENQTTTEDAAKKSMKPEQKDEQPLTEEQRATQQWLRRIPDDPGGLLRRKFRYQYQQQDQNSEEQQSW